MSYEKKLKELHSKERELEKELSSVKRQILSEMIKEFIFTYSIDFKRNYATIPSYLSLNFDEEYNDEGGTYTYLSNVYFFDEENDIIDLDFSVEYERNELSFESAVKDMLSEKFDSDELNDYFADEKIALN